MTPPAGLNLCSLAARGLWISAYAIGGDLPQFQLGVIIGCSQLQAERLIGELLLRRCAVSSADGVRMVCGSDTSEPTGKQRDWASIKREQRAKSTEMSTRLSTDMSTPLSTVDSPHVDIVDKRGERRVSLHPSQENTLTTPVKGFTEFWENYPRKTAKTLAVKAFAKLNPSPEMLEKILAALAIHRETEQWKCGPQYIPHAATWLNQRRFDDEITQVSQQNATRNGERNGNFGRSFAQERENRNRAAMREAAELAARRLANGADRDAGPGGGSFGGRDDAEPVRRLSAAAGGYPCE